MADKDRNERRLMTREELAELGYERLQCELGNLCDWVLELGDEQRELSPYVERYHSLKAELSIIAQYRSMVQSVLRAIRDAI